MRRLCAAALAAFFIAPMASRADVISSIATNATVPLPVGSCFLIDQSGTTDAKLCSNYAAAINAIELNGPAGTPSSISLANGTNLPVSGIAGLGAGVSSLLATPTSANLRTAITDETGTGFLYFQGGDLGTPSAGILTSATGLPIGAGTTGTLAANRGGTGQTTYSAGQLLIGKNDGSLAKATITAGSNVTVTNGDGSIIIAASGGGGGSLTNGSLGDFLRSDGAGGFGTALTPGSGVAAFLGSPAQAIPGTWLGGTAISDNLGYTPANAARTITGTGMLAGGGSLAADRTLNLAALAANSLIGNPTGSSAVPIAVTLPACADTGGQHLNYSSGVFSCGTSGGAGGGSLTVTDGANPVSSTTNLTFDSKNFVVGTTGGGQATVAFTYTVGTDRSAADYTIDTSDSNTMLPVGASHTYTLAQAGTAGFGTGWSVCLQNVSGSGNATISTTTSVFKGAGGATSFKLEAGGWACMASKSGDWYTQAGHYDTLPSAVYLTGSISPTALSGNTDDYNPAGLSGASTIFIDPGAADRNLTGLQGGADGRIITIVNNSASSKNLTLVNNATSSASNRFQMSGDTVLPANTSVTFRYDSGSNRWRPISRTLSNTTVTAGSYTCTDVTVGTDGRLTSAASGSCTGSAVVNVAFASIGWVAGIDPNNTVIMTATTGMTVTAIRGRVATGTGAAATVAVYKAPSGTACSGGTNQASGTFDANGTANTNQTLTLAGGGANSLSAGDSLCLVTTGGANWTGGSGNGGITVAYTTP